MRDEPKQVPDREDQQRAERAVVLQLLRHDREQHWSAAELADALPDVGLDAVKGALTRLEACGVVYRAGPATLRASDPVRRLDELGMIGV
jgi:hypothetical protein